MLCEQRPSLIVFQKIQKLVFFQLANKIFFSGKMTGKPSDLYKKEFCDPAENSTKTGKLD